LDCTQKKGRQAPRGTWAAFLQACQGLVCAGQDQCYFGSCPDRSKASLGPCLAVPTLKRHTALGQSSYRRGSALCTRAGPNAILGPALPGPRLPIGHPWQCPRQSTT